MMGTDIEAAAITAALGAFAGGAIADGAPGLWNVRSCRDAGAR